MKQFSVKSIALSVIIFFSFPASCVAALSSADITSKAAAIDMAEPQKLVSFDGVWRAALVRWAFDLMDHWHLSRTNVAFALEIFEHYVDKRAGLQKNYNLYFATSLLIAIKLNQRHVRIKDLIKYCDHVFGKKEVFAAEREICERLCWKTFYPIPAQFIQIVYDYMCLHPYYKHDDELKVTVQVFYKVALFESEKACFKAKGMRSRALAVNNMIDAVNAMAIPKPHRDFLFSTIKKLVDK